MKRIIAPLLLSLLAIDAIDPGLVPIPGKAVYIKKSNTLWVFSFSKNTQAGNKLSFIDLNQSFNSLSPPVVDKSSLITNNQCPVMHFAQALPSADGVSINIFGAGSDLDGVYESSMTICRFNTETNAWKQIQSSGSKPLARRNAALEFTSSNLTWFFGGSSDFSTGYSSTTPSLNYWHQDTSIFDSSSGVWINGPQYNGYPRANATMTQISDTNGQMLIIGGSVVSNLSAVDMVTNHLLASMSDIIILDPRTSIWTNAKTYGDNIPIGRKHHTTTLHPDGRTLVVIGGEFFNDTGAYLLNDVWTLDTRNMNNLTWTQPVINGQGFFRSNHTSILIGDQIWVIAGTNQSSKAVDIQLLNLTSWTWTQSVAYNQPPSVPFSQIGGLKGFIGLIVGVTVGVSLMFTSIGYWWCRRHRIKPFLKKKKNGSHTGPANFEYEIAQNMAHSVDENSKTFMSQPPLSHTIPKASGDFNSNAHTLFSRTSKGDLYVDTDDAYLHQPGSAEQTHFPQTSSSYEDRYSEENYFVQDNGNIYNVDQSSNELYGYGGDLTNTVSFNHSQQPQGYWDSLIAVPTHRISNVIDNATFSSGTNYFLTPSNNRIDERNFFKNQNINQQLQKPNEVDHATTELSTNTVGSSLTADEDAFSSSTPNASVEPFFKSVPTAPEEKKQTDPRML